MSDFERCILDQLALDLHDAQQHLADTLDTLSIKSELLSEALTLIHRQSLTITRLTTSLRRCMDLSQNGEAAWSAPTRPAAVPDVDLPTEMVRARDINWTGR